MQNQKGFSVTELVVGVACVTLLAAVVVPVIGNQITAAKIARAKADCQEIAKAMQAFYEDMGHWPDYEASGKNWNGYSSLMSGTTIYSSTPYGMISDNTGDAQSLINPLGDATKIDLINNHLTYNTPVNGGYYPTSSGGNGTSRYWKGPYIQPIGLDPWGHPYVVNVSNTGAAITRYPRIVVSAGPDGIMKSVVNSDGCDNNTITKSDPDNDDIYVLFDCGKSYDF